MTRYILFLIFLAVQVFYVGMPYATAQTNTNPTFNDVFGTHKLCGGNTGILCGEDTGSNQDAKNSFIKLANLLLKIMLIVAGFIAFFLFLTAGYDYLGSEGDPKKLQSAGNKIVYAGIGLLLLILAPIFAGILSLIIYGDWNAILQLKGIGDPINPNP